jgi:methionyl-tRNA synthetase
VSTDDNQLYVDTSAQKSGRSTEDLVTESRRDIEETIARYSLGIERLGQNDKQYEGFVTNFFKDALDEGLIEITEAPVAVDSFSGRYLEGPQVNGACPSCLAAACGGICEACGDPNRGFDLISHEARNKILIAHQPRLTVDLEAHRSFLSDFFNECQIQSPKLRAKLSAWMERPLGRFVLSYPASRGVDAPRDAPAGHKLNVWAEMYPGHFYHLEKVCSGILPTDKYVQFLGFDNSYFYTILHGALAQIGRACGRDWPLPSALVVNRFYNLGFEKFSTSLGVAVWANDLADRYHSDLIRFFLALHGPEHDEASFFAEAAGERILQIAELVNRVATAFNDSGVSPDSALREPFSNLCSPNSGATRYSMREVATAALRRLEFIDRCLAHGDADIVGQAPLVLKSSLASLCPVFSNEIHVGQTSRIPVFGSSEGMPLLIKRPRSQRTAE